MAKGLNAFMQTFLAQQQQPILTYDLFYFILFLEKISYSN
jgi:hypothetical protein